LRHPNVYSRRWHEVFHRHYDPEVTAREVAFLAQWLPPGRVLDVCCGYGRHMRGLRELGYETLGVERDPVVAAEAGALCLDSRQLDRVPGLFDGVICMWASFGHFSEEENRELLEAMKRKLRSGGRLVLDLQNREFFEPRRGRRELRPGILETSTLAGGRRRIQIDYGDGALDEFDFQLFTPEEVRAAVDLPCLYERSSPHQPRMLFVFEVGVASGRG
jgi:SAM-dependent methyltransferase